MAARPDSLEEAQLQAIGVGLQEDMDTTRTSPEVARILPSPARPIMIGNEPWSEGFMRVVDEWKYNNFTDGSARTDFETGPFKSMIHKHLAENYELQPLRGKIDFERANLRQSDFTPMGFVLLRVREYEYFIQNEKLSFDWMKDYDFINIWPSLSDAVLQKAYLEASRFSLFSADRYIILGINFHCHKLRDDLRAVRASTFERYGGNSISVALHRDSGHFFTKDEMTLHEASYLNIQSPGELRDMMLAKMVFNHYQACFSFGPNFERPSPFILCNIFIFYDLDAWLHYGSTLNDNEALSFIGEEHFGWVPSRPGYGFTEVKLPQEALDNAYRFKKWCVDQGLIFKKYELQDFDEEDPWGDLQSAPMASQEQTTSDQENFSLTKEDVEMATGFFTRLLSNLRCPSRSSGDLQMEADES